MKSTPTSLSFSMYADIVVVLFTHLSSGKHIMVLGWLRPLT